MTMLTFLNTWGGCGPGYFDYINYVASKSAVLCLSEIHNGFGDEDEFVVGDRITNRTGAVQLKQFSKLKHMMEKTHQGYFSEAYRGIHDQVSADHAPQGLAMFVQRHIPTYGMSSSLIAGRYGRQWEERRGSSACRVIQSCFVVIEGSTYLIAHIHGIWDPKGKSDTHERLTQSKRIIEHLTSQLQVNRNDESVGIILGGDFNYTRELEAFASIQHSNVVTLLEPTVGSYDDTRTKYYDTTHKASDVREADFVFVSPGLPAELKIDQRVPSDHAAMIVTL